MYSRYFMFSIASLLGLMSVWASSSFAETFSACYALQNGKGDGHPPRTQLNRICLSERGDISLYGANGFRYDFHVDATFYPKTYSCHVNRHTGNRSCQYSLPYINFSGHDARAWINENVVTRSDGTNHGALTVSLDLDQYIFWDNQPQICQE